MQTRASFSSFIIGEGTLPIQCAGILLAGGHEVYGIISDDTAVHRWAQERDIPHAQPCDDLGAFMGRRPFDYLFSVVNGAILPQDVLALPRKGAINYHDAPLPRYAGSHATSWALMGRERTHGIAWHLMAARVDAGDILKQRVVDIAPGETAFTLNAKCYEAAIGAFAELADDLAAGHARPVAQNLDERSFFPLHKRPPAGGILSWNRCAYDLAALVRALDFGTYPNPLGLPKLLVGQGIVAVSTIEVLDAPSTVPPGTITAIGSDRLTVATASHEIALRGLLTVDGQPLSIPDLGAAFGLREGDRLAEVDPAMAERLTACGEAFSRHEAYWVDRLASLQPLTLPYADRRTPAGEPAQYACVPLHISPQIAALGQGQRDQSIETAGDLVLAAFAAYLARIGGVASFDIGYRAAALSHEIAGLDACFAPCVPLRVDVAVEHGTRTLARTLRDTVEQVGRRKTYARDIVARYPKLRAIPELRQGSTPSVVVERVETLNGYAAFPGSDLTFVIAGDGTECAWVYDTAALEPDDAARLLRQFSTFLRGIAAAPDRPVADIPLLDEEERRHILAEFNDTATDYGAARCLHHLVEAQVERTPDAVGVVFEGQRLTYCELNRQANRLARRLRACGVGPEVLVGICMERSLELVVGLLGILKAGGAYVPFDPSYPSERLAFMLEDAGAPVLVTRQRLRERLCVGETQIICLDGDWLAGAGEDADAENLDSDVTPDNLAYMIYTSGSTGRPKGAMNTHRGIYNRLVWMQDAYGLTDEDRVLQKTPFSFDVSVWEFFWPLLTGARLVVARPDGHRDSAYLAGLIASEGITTLHFVPSMLYAFLDEPELGRCASLKRVICSGEALPVDLHDRFFARLDGVELHNLYGPTEAAVDVTYWACRRGGAGRNVPIGRPIANTQMYVLDRQLQPVPIGLTGELYIGGVNLARGYLNRPDLTAEKFVPDPLGAEPGARLYRTGDLARYRPAGAIEFLGRRDHQVKVRGFRIELGEIETVLSQHPSVREAVVVALAQQDNPIDQRLVAYVTPRAGQTVEPDALRGHLAERLPAHMVPAALVALEGLPLTPNGKLDRRALPAPEWAQHPDAAAYAAPRTPTEEVLAAVWSTILGVERVGRRDDFFALGGHSLLATQVVSRVREAFGVELPLRILFESPTLEGLAAQIEAPACVGSDVSDAAPPIALAPRDGELPLSPGQERLWFVDQLDPGQATYSIPLALRLHGPLDVAALRRTLAALVRRHEALRTTFPQHDGAPRQRIGPAPRRPLPLVMHDLRTLPPQRREAQARRLATEEAARPFDLASGPLLRAALLRLDDAAHDHILLLTLHHIIADGWSLAVLCHDLGALYAAAQATQDAPLAVGHGVAGTAGAPLEGMGDLEAAAGLAPLAVQPADVALGQQQWLHSPAAAAQVAYWRRQLAGAPPVLTLPTDRPRPPAQTFCGATLHQPLGVELSAGVHALSRHLGATPFMTTLAAFWALLARYSGQHDLVVATSLAGRTRTQTEGLIGFFVNTLPLRGDLRGDPSFAALVDRARTVALGAYAHQELPFARLVEAVQPRRDPRYAPLVQVLFELQNTPPPTLELAGVVSTPFALEGASAKFDLTLTLAEEDGDGEAGAGGGLSAALEYNTDLFDAATMGRLLGHYRTLLTEAVADPSCPLSQLPLLPEPEQRLLMEWNATDAAYPQDVCIHHLFEAQAARTPDAVAIVDGRRQLTYAQLNARANQVAHQLHALGVGPETRVAICLERSAELIVGLLGILKAGGAYVPLEPSYPVARMQSMLSSLDVHCLVTQTSLLWPLRELSDLPPLGHVLCLDEATMDDGAAALWQQQLIHTCAALDGLPEDDIAVPISADNTAYVIFTSGSTGTPKGVIVCHRPVINLIDWVNDTFHIGAGDRLLFVTSPCFDLSVYDIFGVLAAGASIRVAATDELREPRMLLRILCEEPITFWDSAPAALQQVAPFFPGAQRGGGASRLRLVFLSGDWIPVALPDTIRRSFPRAEVVGLGGATEATVWSNYYRIGAVDPHWVSIPYGKPIQNARYYILDARLNACPIGVVGDLYIGGVCLASGYNDPALTAEKFVPDPLGAEPGARLYRTGDLARYRPAGAIEFLGRRDHQVKVRGFRIELGEIETVLSQHPSVREAVVVARSQTASLGQADRSGDQRLVAYVTPRAGQTLEPDALRGHLAERLPAHMVPAALVALEGLPLTPNGKLDRRALPAPEWTPVPGSTTQAEPDEAALSTRTPMEELVQEMWRDVLGMERIGIDDNFFALGGHSLSATQVLARLYDATHVEIGMQALFEEPTPRGLARVLSARLAEHDDPETLAGVSATALAVATPTATFDLTLTLLEEEGAATTERLLGRHRTQLAGGDLAGVVELAAEELDQLFA